MTKEEVDRLIQEVEKLAERMQVEKDNHVRGILFRGYISHCQDIAREAPQYYPNYLDALANKRRALDILNDPNYLDLYHQHHAQNGMNPNILDFISPVTQSASDKEVDATNEWHLAVAAALRELLMMKDAEGKWFFSVQYQWYAVYKVMIDNVVPHCTPRKFVENYLTPGERRCILPEDMDSLPNPKKFEYGVTESCHLSGAARDMEKGRHGKYDNNGKVIDTMAEFLRLLKKHRVIRT